MSEALHTPDPHALIAFGANLPLGTVSPAETIMAAVVALREEGVETRHLSRLFRTPCFPAGAGPDYVNAAALVVGPATDDLTSLLAALHRVEARFGRLRGERWGMRTLDIDLLARGDSVLPDAEVQDAWRRLDPAAQVGTVPDRLILPHPRLQDRAFVLVPLAEVAPGWRHPRTGLTVAQMLAALPAADIAEVKPL
jgi:2-amino-4-hydroxy-6-hydroxymethyldihydropteridine diphosphokinase